MDVHTLSLHEAFPIYIIIQSDERVAADWSGQIPVLEAHQRRFPNRIQQDAADRDDERRDEQIGRLVLLQLVPRSEEHTSELQSLTRIPYAFFCFKNKRLI